ncbi:helix-turn-helix domain-containing protein [Belliella aquatica]|uniref:Transcriptional regulator n=1 Tax=Belliella aquatica TaxID=1323734 RepID=A0ABQ1N2X8_9BACT|nr:XRE family transcriptional regulator [Belliella aquatica]MCH7407439.1 XRE family transcriptional regulator [Belliella aquatica]GGC49239.1 transcriptional regulator [Belliella aquatica]
MKYLAERLKSARLMNGLSLQGLADQINNYVTKQALSKYEQGQVVPDSEMIGILAEALHVRPDYFHADTAIEFGVIEFRKLESYPAKEKNRIVEIAKNELSRYIELEEILGIETKFHNPLEEMPINSLEDIDKAAEKLREAWGLGTDAISNVIELLEDHHVKVIEIDSEESFDGFATWVNAKDIPLIVLNKAKFKNKLDRKRFTALHELGHLLLDVNRYENKQKEKYCHAFASAMLIHKETLRQELGGKRNKLSMNELGAIKQQYGISMQALVYRAKNLGLISDNYLKQFYMVFNQLGFRVTEPVDYEGMEHSNRFSQLLFRALAEEYISISKAAALKNQKLAEFRKENMVI